MIEMNFTPFPILETERLFLRPIEAGDDKDIFMHRADERVNTYLKDFRHNTIEETQAFIERVQKEIANSKSILWVITQKGHHRFLGTVCLWNISKEEEKAETGYTLDPEFHRMGYMNEALVNVLDFGFNKMKLKAIDAYTHKHNEGSIKLLQKNKFKQSIPPKVEVGNDRIYFLLESEK